MSVNAERKMTKLYKFRSLGSCEDLRRAVEILTTGKFWCSRFWDLNDPMEGVYLYKPDTTQDRDRNRSNTHQTMFEFLAGVFGAKGEAALCSFTGSRALKNPLMWGYYANGFRGLAFEIEGTIDQSNTLLRERPLLKKVEYVSEVPSISGPDAVLEILTKKIKKWRHEQECRFIVKGDAKLYEIGTITAVYFGDPYRSIVNRDDIEGQQSFKTYECRKRILEHLIHQINECTDRNIQCHYMDITGDGKVVQLPKREKNC